MIAGGPFVMIAQQQVGLLLFGDAQGLTGTGLVIVLGYVSGLGIEVTDLKKDAVLGSKLLFETGGQVQLFQIVIGSLAVFSAVIGIERVTGITKEAVLGAALDPIATAEIFGAGEDAQAFRSKQARVFLLRNTL